MPSDLVVIYHAGCADGFAAAWLFHLAFPDAEFVPANYGDPPPDVAGRRVFVADFSYKRPVMREVIRAAASVVVLDHHKTAEAELAGIADEFADRTTPPVVVFDMNKSGARLAWEHLYGNRLLPPYWLTTSESGRSLGVAPWLVDYTEDRDLWRWVLPYSREVDAVLRSYPFGFDFWDDLSRPHPQDLAPEGSAILRAERRVIDSHVRHAREVSIGGHRVPAVNATTLASEIAGELAEGKPFGAVYFDRGDGRRVWSLRSRDGGVDVSEVARALGGGGHRNAAGFTTAIPAAD